MKIEINATLNDRRKIIAFSQYAGKFKEGDFEGEVYIDSSILVNHKDGRQWEVSIAEIVEAICKEQNKIS